MVRCMHAHAYTAHDCRGEEAVGCIRSCTRMSPSEGRTAPVVARPFSSPHIAGQHRLPNTGCPMNDLNQGVPCLGHGQSSLAGRTAVHKPSLKAGALTTPREPPRRGRPDVRKVPGCVRLRVAWGVAGVRGGSGGERPPCGAHNVGYLAGSQSTASLQRRRQYLISLRAILGDCVLQHVCCWPGCWT